MAETEFDRERATGWVTVGTLSLATLACLIAGIAVAAVSGNLGGWFSIGLGLLFLVMTAFQLRRQLKPRASASRRG